MTRQAIPFENVEAITRDVADALENLQYVLKVMAEASLKVVYGHPVRVETDSVPRLWKFADDLRVRVKMAKRAAETGQPDPAIAEIEKARKTVKRRQAERKNGKPK